MTRPSPAAAPAPRAPLASPSLAVAQACAERLTSGGALAASDLSRLMTEAHGGTDAGGAWSWRAAYDAVEAAQIIAFRRASAGSLRGDPAGLLGLARAIAGRCPTQSRRSEAQLRLQQFSTPLPLAVVVAAAAQPRRGETVLEPSCGTGLIAAALRAMGATVVLNEIDPGRAALAAAALGASVSGRDAEFIDDLLDAPVAPTLVAMNPPFSSSAARTADPAIAGRRLVSALKRLRPGGRLVAIMPAGFDAGRSHGAAWRDAGAWAALRLRLALPTDAFRAHGASVETVLVVYDKAAVSAAPVHADAATLDEALAVALSVTRGAEELGETPSAASLPLASVRRTKSASVPRTATPVGASTPALALRREKPEPLEYVVVETVAGDAAAARDGGGLYTPYRVARIAIPGAADHATPLVESAAMAAITPPAPSHRPLLAPSLIRRGALSDAQLESWSTPARP
ncbi:methyltransferase [Rubrimonas cliftonensis]|uniref:Methyltransferase small domain-containing protein n=1 Tax=Rubrimonas cliftonensis TaxID=89524 RepID=A0A1H4EJY3_9RHOB|nr:methyltransferase [Rubrimonas cliftonensis]SEA85374.1 Methyltransferase small domain-containing protein [Rubrimonas cliftonensis]